MDSPCLEQVREVGISQIFPCLWRHGKIDGSTAVAIWSRSEAGCQDGPQVDKFHTIYTHKMYCIYCIYYNYTIHSLYTWYRNIYIYIHNIYNLLLAQGLKRPQCFMNIPIEAKKLARLWAGLVVHCDEASVLWWRRRRIRAPLWFRSTTPTAATVIRWRRWFVQVPTSRSKVSTTVPQAPSGGADYLSSASILEVLWGQEWICFWRYERMH